MFCISNIETFKTIHFAYYHSVMKYRKIIGHNLTRSKNIFTVKNY